MNSKVSCIYRWFLKWEVKIESANRGLLSITTSDTEHTPNIRHFISFSSSNGPEVVGFIYRWAVKE